MSSRAMGWAMKQTHVGPHALLTLIVLSDGCDDDGGGILRRRWLREHTALTWCELEIAIAELVSTRLLAVGSMFEIHLPPEAPITANDSACALILGGPLAAEDALGRVWGEVQWQYGDHDVLGLTSKDSLKQRAITAFRFCCAYCERQGTSTHDPDGSAWELDRIIPGAHGGEYRADNVALACRACNRDKRARLDWDIDTPSLLVTEGLAANG